MEHEPAPGAWFETDDGQTFRVVGYDPANGAIEIQYPDGRIGELDLASWRDLAVVEIEPLEEWRASMDEFLARRARHPK